MSDRQGIEIDYCPDCRGVWLDRGELDKIIERSAAPAPRRSDDDDRRRPDSDHSRSYDYKKKRKSVLGEIFDF
ncbi:MAG: zf-TFIIB domain-containing protein [Ilumatobacteraceae bacterium]